MRKPHEKTMRIPVAILSLMFLLLRGGILPVSAESAGGEMSPDAPGNPAGPVPSEARRMALETAGAFLNDGFRIRDGEWAVSLSKGTPAFLQVSLFEGNSYWFVSAVPDAGTRLRITVYDGEGRPLKGEEWKESGKHGGTRAAVGIAPARSGSYFVGVELLEGSTVEASLVYAYK